LLGKTCGQLAQCYFQLGDYESAKIYQLSLLQIQIVCALSEHKMIDGVDIAESLNYLGVIFCLEKKYQLSNMCYRYALTALECMSNQQSSLIEGELHYNIGSLYFIQSGVQAFEENQEVFFEQELENKQRFILLANDYFKISLKYGVPPEKIEPKLAMLAEASQREKEAAQFMEGTVKAVLDGACEEKLEQNIPCDEVVETQAPITRLESPLAVEELSPPQSLTVNIPAEKPEKKNTIGNRTVNLKSPRPFLRVNTSFPQNNVVYHSPRPASITYFHPTRAPICQNYSSLLQTPFPLNTITLLPTPKSHYNGSSTLFPAGSPRTQNSSPKSNQRNSQYPAAQYFSLACFKK
jgi:tetratricopeptide (TPR) repeat protein